VEWGSERGGDWSHFADQLGRLGHVSGLPYTQSLVNLTYKYWFLTKK
jgi:hypothetical protein